MSRLRRVVVDVLKPHDPRMLKYVHEVEELDSVSGVNAVLVENDEDVENIKMTVEGDGFEFESVEQKIDELGGSVHSVDEAVAGDHPVDESKTPQD